MTLEAAAKAAADRLREAKTLVVTAGAGMGVDSGLPDFRGDQGFWKAYPMYERLGLSFVDAANPERFREDPAFGWGFYGHRLNLYRATVPHAGFALLRKWIDRLGLASFVVTSNVDGQFQKAGFPEEAILEVHGSIHHLQCMAGCSERIWENREEVPVDLATMRARRVPKCIACTAIARPNILMFGDFGWVDARTEEQRGRLDAFASEHVGDRTVVIEMGAGTAIPTIRFASERIGGAGLVVRMNPREPRIDAPHLSMACGALEGLTAIDRALDGTSR
jgi:NAD-dependent SIR2 family protein deacetylase